MAATTRSGATDLIRASGLRYKGFRMSWGLGFRIYGLGFRGGLELRGLGFRGTDFEKLTKYLPA